MISDFWFLISLTNRLSYRGSSRNLNSTARPYDQQAFSPPDPTAIWHLHLALAIYIFVVVNFDALAQASDFRIERRYIHTYIYTYIFVVVNFDALAHASDIRIERRQVVFLGWRQDSNPEGLRHLFASRLNACWQTDWAIEDQAKNLNSTGRPYDQQAFSPPDPTAIWHLHLALAIYIFVVVNFDALAQTSDFRIERRYIHTYKHTYIFVVVNFDALAQASDIRMQRRQVVFLCWRQDSNPEGLRHLFASRLNACWQTDWAIEDQAKNLNSTARPYDQQAYSPPDPASIWHSHLALAIYIFVVVHFDALAQASDIRIERRQVVFLGWRQDSNPEGLRHLFASRRNACWQTDWAIEDQAKNLISTAHPYDQQAFSPSYPPAIWHSHIHTYMFVVVNFDALY